LHSSIGQKKKFIIQGVKTFNMFNFPPILIGAGEGSTAILDHFKGLELENTFSFTESTQSHIDKAI